MLRVTVSPPQARTPISLPRLHTSCCLHSLRRGGSQRRHQSAHTCSTKRIFNDTSLHRHHPTITAPSCCWISAHKHRDFRYVIVEVSLLRRCIAGWRNGDAMATAMDGATAMRWRRNGNNDAMATTAGGSLAAARRQRRRRCWQRYRMMAVAAEA